MVNKINLLTEGWLGGLGDILGWSTISLFLKMPPLTPQFVAFWYKTKEGKNRTSIRQVFAVPERFL